MLDGETAAKLRLQDWSSIDPEKDKLSDIKIEFLNLL